jgi:Mg-chelatase subunit ChlD
VRVAAAPEVAGLLRDVLAGSSRTSGCPAAVVQARPAADVAAALAHGGAGADAWVPDSSTWLARVPAAALGTGRGTSLARTPVVMAVPARAVRTPWTGGFGALLDPGPGLSVAVLDPTRSAAGLAAAVELAAVVHDAPARRGAVTALLRAPKRPDADLPGLARATGDLAHTAVPTTEQAVRAHDASSPSPDLVAVYAGSRQPVLDYPYVELAGDPARRDAAARLLPRLQTPAARTVLLDAGFRDADGLAAPGDAAALGVDPARRIVGSVPSDAEAAAALRASAAVNAPAQVLAVLDVSGSMAALVPGQHGATRLDLAREAAARGLALYPDDTRLGLWTFASRAGTPDHVQVVPITELGQQADGSSGRRRLAAALAGARPGGDTPLYDTALAAVRALRAGWRPGRVNLVVLLSDGKDEDPRGTDLPHLLATLRAEQDPARPTPVISIAYGPDSDAASLAAISRATGGASYTAKDPAQIRQVFLDAVGQRACRPRCTPAP